MGDSLQQNETRNGGAEGIRTLDPHHLGELEFNLESTVESAAIASSGERQPPTGETRVTVGK